MFNLNTTVKEMVENEKVREFVSRQSGLPIDEVEKRLNSFSEEYGSVTVFNLPKLIFGIIVTIRQEFPEEATSLGTKEDIDELLTSIEEYYGGNSDELDN